MESILNGLAQCALWLFRAIYRPRVTGLDRLKEIGDGPALVIANHVSYLDGLLLAAYIPRRLTFAIDPHWLNKWWVRPLARFFTAVPVDRGQPLATRALLDALAAGGLVVVFPEGRLTTTGSLMKVYEGSAILALKGGAPIVPVVIDGPQFSRFSRLGPTVRPRRKFRTSLAIMGPRRLEVAPRPGERQKDYRARATGALYDLMRQCAFQAVDCRRDLWTALNGAAAYSGLGTVAIEDAQRRPLTYRRFLWLARALGRRFAALSQPGECVGLMLPNSTALTAALFGLLAGSRTAVMLNFTQGPGPMASALETARIKTVVTSRRFLAETGLMGLAQGLKAHLVYLDEAPVTPLEELRGLFWAPAPAAPDSPAVIVFTSGSEGKPKGVVLSHANLLSNVAQFSQHMSVTPHDVIFNALPMFHAFGLTVGVLTPLLWGARLFNYTTPLHTKVIPELIYDTGATVAAASDTFLSAWGRNAHPYDFRTLRYVIEGAEKLKPRTHQLYMEKFGLRVTEGYGASETAPVVSVNNHLRYRYGTVGTLLPGLEARVEPVEGVARGGELWLKGPNIMLGYLMPDNPGVLKPPKDGWYDTGDIVEMDGDGFITILGRFKRFAKVGGEMVSLAAVEEVAMNLWPGAPRVVIAMEDEAKGERLVYITADEGEPDLAALWQALKEAGLPEIYYPRHWLRLPEMPITPVGKLNMPKLMEMAREAAAAGQAR